MMAVERGDAASAYNVGTCYGRGYGVAEDPDKAFEYYMMAAEAGYANAQFQVGNFYYEGRGNVRHDYAAAVRWLEHAYANRSDREDIRAAAELAVCYQNGLGSPAKAGESPVWESNRERQNPKYRKTRGTLREVGGTTPQG